MFGFFFSSRHDMLSMVFSAKSKEFQQLNSIYTCPQVHCSTNIEIYFSWKLEFLFKRFREIFWKYLQQSNFDFLFFVLMISQFVDHNHAISAISILCFDFLTAFRAAICYKTWILKLLKGPGTLRNIEYIFKLSLKNGRKNVIGMFLDNSIYEIT